MLQEHPVQNYIPWRAVWKENSLSTPCRVVFDASSNTGNGFSLNDILVKGRNNMNKLAEISLDGQPMLQLYTLMFKRCITQSSYKKKTGVYKDIFGKKI